MLTEFVQELRNDNSSNAKVDILRKHSSDSRIRELLNYSYNPAIHYFVKKIDDNLPVGQVKADVAWASFRLLLERLIKRELTGDAARYALENILSQCDLECQDLFRCVLNRDLRINAGAKLINKALGEEFIRVPDCQLANKWKPDSKKYLQVPYYWASRKLDGIRAVYQDGIFLSRKQKEIIGFDIIESELTDLVSRYNLTFVDGELFSNKINFQKIQGIVSRKKDIDPAEKALIFYNVFVVGKEDYADTEDLVNQMESIEWNRYPHLTPLKYEKVTNSQVIGKCKEYVAEGYEGIMLRHPEVWYSNKRDDNLLKFKLFFEEDFKIIGYEEGEKGSKYEGQMGSLIVEGTYEGKKIKSNVGTGLKDWQRIEYWSQKEELIGLTVEVKFQNVTDDPDPEGYYSLRFPGVKDLKLDR